VVLSVQQVLTKNKTPVPPQLSYSLDLSSADLFLFPELKSVQNGVDLNEQRKYKKSD
jgi:hypothetical protein